MAESLRRSPDLRDHLPMHLRACILAHDDAAFMIRAIRISDAGAGDIAARLANHGLARTAVSLLNRDAPDTVAYSLRSDLISLGWTPPTAVKVPNVTP